MREITRLIQRYRDGEMSLDELADQLANRENRSPARYDPPPPDADAEKHTCEYVGTFPEEGTRDEVKPAQLHGLLTPEEYRVIHERHPAWSARSQQSTQRPTGDAGNY